MKYKEEFCIMPEKAGYSTKRDCMYCERHEIFFGPDRDTSIEDGLVVFLTMDAHRGTYGVHGREGKEFNLYLKKIGQQAWMDYYGKSTEEFIQRYGKNYL